MTDKVINILLVEDEPAHAEAILRAFHSTIPNTVVNVAGSISQYQSLVSSYPPDLVIMDMNLPDGRALDIMSNKLESNAFPIVVMTSYGNEEIAAETIKAGAIDYVVKSPETLINMPRTVERVLREWKLIQQHKRMEIELRDNEARQRAMIANISDVIAIIDRNGIIKYKSPNIKKWFGWQSEDLVGTIGWDNVHPDDLERIQKEFFILLEKDRASKTTECLFKCKDGSYSLIELTAVNLINDPAVNGVLMNYHDITERKRSEQELREKTRLNQIILDAFPCVALLLNSKTREIVAMNAAAAKSGATIGKTCFGSWPRSSKPCSFCLAPETWATGEERYLIVEALGVVWEAHWVPVSEGLYMHYAFDITERKKAEEALQLSSTRWNTTFDSISDIICVISKDHEFLEINRAGCEFIGFPKEQIIGRKCYELVHGTNAPIAMCPCEATLKTKKYETTTHNENGHYYELSAWPMPVAKDEKEAFVHIVKNITEKVLSEQEKAKLEAQLIQAQKMESVGRLAGGVAHDFNNLLTVIMANSEIGLMSMDSGHPFKEELGEIKSAAERAADLTRQLLAFARKQTIIPKLLDINETVSGMLKMLRRLIGEDIDLVWKPGHNLWPVKVDPSQVDQILANLSVNARDAINGVGNLTIETENAVFDEIYCVNHPGFISGEYVMLAVSDTGSGMDAKTLEKLFEPFTTKEVGKGTGLGLATVYGAVKQNNGFINVYSEPGHGTTFKIYLPRVFVQNEAPALTTDVNNMLSHGTETVLLAEDEIKILKLGKTILEQNGYTVLAASTPREAFALADKHDGPIHLLVTDVVMPGMNGKDLRDMLAVRWPEIKTLFMSGYTANVIAHHGIIDEGIQFLQKPFSGNTLAIKVRETLDK